MPTVKTWYKDQLEQLRVLVDPVTYPSVAEARQAAALAVESGVEVPEANGNALFIPQHRVLSVEVVP